MLEGREISELKLSELENEFTIGSEYYKREFIDAVETIEKSAFEKLPIRSCTKLVTDGDHGQAVYEDSGILYLLSESIKEGYIDLDGNGTRFISPKTHEELKRSELKSGDVVVTKTGVYFGKSSVIPEEIQTANTSAHVAKITVKENLLNPYYFSTFLNSKFGYSQLRRRGIKVSRPEIKLIEFRDILISIPHIAFQKRIEKIILQGQSVIEQAKQTYQQAENFLLEVIGLKDFTPSKEKTNVKNFSECFQISERLDAEFYQRKYDEIESKIKQNKKWNNLGDIQTKIDTGEYAPAYFRKDEAKDLTFYIRSTNIKRGQIELDEDYYVQKKNFVRIAEKGDIVTARVGSVGIFGEVRKELEGAIYSDNILCFRLPDSFTPSVYTILFNTKYYFDLIDRLARGSVQQRLNQETLKDLVVPFIESKTQEKISELIEESFRLKKESENLLEIAKRAVEMAIEETEDAAIEFINAEI